MIWPLLASLSSSDIFFLIHYSANLLAVLTLQYATMVPTCKPLNSYFLCLELSSVSSQVWVLLIMFILNRHYFLVQF